MRQLVCRSFGSHDGLAIESGADPSPGPGQVLVKINAANVAFVDRLIVQGAYQVRPALPFTPGVVGAGEIAAVSSGIENLRVGDRVTVFKEDIGVWATHVVVPATAVVKTPSGVSDVAAATCIEAYGTASYALERRGNLQAGETVLVLGGSGAVGHAAVELALHLDAHVIALTSAPDLWNASSAKPEVVLDRRVTNLREVMRDRFPEGVDIVFDPVGGDMCEAALRSLSFGGRYLVVGFASGTIPKLPANHILLRNRTVLGVEWASWLRLHDQHLRQSMEIVLSRLARGIFTPPRAVEMTLEELRHTLLGPPPKSGLIRTVVLPE